MSTFMRESYCAGIENALTSLHERLTIRVASNLTDVHIYAEAIMVSVLNPAFELCLRNANVSEQNAAAVDLVDDQSKTVVQVSGDASRSKIQSTLNKKKLGKYAGYHLMFVFLVAKHPSYTGKPFDNPYGIRFDAKGDIYDIGSLMTLIRALPIGRLESAYDGIRREIMLDHMGTPQLSYGLASIVGALITSDPDEQGYADPIAFRIEEKIRMNSLLRYAQEIRDLSVLTYPLDDIYEEYEREGMGRARSVFHHLQMTYRGLADRGLSPDELYVGVIHALLDKISPDERLLAFRYEDVEFYVEVVVVDAFMRCKLFDGPDVWEDGR